jgi:O-acetyl-ADP-ribose deacetylase (regulator of RNase III)
MPNPRTQPANSPVMRLVNAMLIFANHRLRNRISSTPVAAMAMITMAAAFLDNYAAYAAACKRGEVEPGRMFVFHTNTLHNPRFIINFPTKRHWKGKSRLKDIESGLNDLIEVVQRERIHSIAVPPLGCGNGGLDWDQVRPRIERAFAEVPEVQLYEPKGAPKKR